MMPESARASYHRSHVLPSSCARPSASWMYQALGCAHKWREGEQGGHPAPLAQQLGAWPPVIYRWAGAAPFPLSSPFIPFNGPALRSEDRPDAPNRGATSLDRDFRTPVQATAPIELKSTVGNPGGKVATSLPGRARCRAGLGPSLHAPPNLPRLPLVFLLFSGKRTGVVAILFIKRFRRRVVDNRYRS